jgi:hypothetical protein
MTLLVPFKRQIKYHMIGADVLATKRALAHAGLRKWGYGFTKTAGRRWVRDIRNFQQRHGLHVDGVYGPQTHAKLVKFFDRYAASLYNHYHPPKVVTSKRSQIVSTAIFGYNHRGSIHYTQSGLRMYGVRNRIRPPRVTYYEDCSSFATWCYWVAGALDPNGLGYNGYGFTGTLASHGKRVATPRPGDLVFYGWFPYRHVAIYIGGGKIISHGSEVGPVLTTPHYRSDFSHYRSYLP